MPSSSSSSSSSPVSTPVPSDPVEAGKHAAAVAAVNRLINANTRSVGIGSGSTIVYAAEYLAALAKHHGWTIQCVPTSFQSRQLILKGAPALQLASLDECPQLDVTIDGADEVDSELNCIKGGGACMLQEKIVASAAKVFAVIADHRKDSQRLGEKWKQGIPLEVLPFGYQTVLHRLRELGGRPTLRLAPGGKAGPVITDNGMFVVDVDMGVLDAARARELNVVLSTIPGVTGTGLFVSMAKHAFFGDAEGHVVTRDV